MSAVPTRQLNLIPHSLTCTTTATATATTATKDVTLNFHLNYDMTLSDFFQFSMSNFKTIAYQEWMNWLIWNKGDMNWKDV